MRTSPPSSVPRLLFWQVEQPAQPAGSIEFSLTMPLDLFGRLVGQLPGLGAMLVITFRPEFVAPWLGRAHVTSLSLNRFGRRQALAMIAHVVGDKALPAEVTEQIV